MIKFELGAREYQTPNAKIVEFDFADLIRTSGEAAVTKETPGNYQDTGWDNLLKGGMN